MWVGLGVSLLASAAGGVPVLLSERRGVDSRPFGMLASMLVRFFVVLLGIAYVLVSDLAQQAPFLVWTGLGYLALLPVDVVYLVRGRNAGTPPSDRPSREDQ